MTKKRAEPFNIAGGDFYPTPHHCHWCGGYHYGLCPQSMAPLIEEIRLRLEELHKRDDELEAMIQYLYRKLKRVSHKSKPKNKGGVP